MIDIPERGTDWCVTCGVSTALQAISRECPSCDPAPYRDATAARSEVAIRVANWYLPGGVMA